MKRRRVLLGIEGNTPPQELVPIHRFPLAYNGDLFDAVGGGVIVPNGNFAWDAIERKYKATLQQSVVTAYINNLSLGQVAGLRANNLTMSFNLQVIAFQPDWTSVIESQGNSISAAFNNAQVQAGQVSTIVNTYDGANSKTYVDGVLSETVVKANTTFADNLQLIIGRSPYSTGSGQFYIWNIRFFDKVLTQDEINNL